MNIFKVISSRTSLIEPVHSGYLAECLSTSRELLASFWSLAVKGSAIPWPVPSDVEVFQEYTLEGGKRIDILIRDSQGKRVMGIEVKTSESSMEEGQLDLYRSLLLEEYPDHKIWIVYLTPFNAVNPPRDSEGNEQNSKCSNEFTKFQKGYSSSSHLSWTEVSQLRWNEADDVWMQHQQYVVEVICQPVNSRVVWGSLEEDFGLDTMQAFWTAIDDAGITNDEGKITLKPTDDPRLLLDALRILITHESVRKTYRPGKAQTDGFPKDRRRRFLVSTYASFHDKIFKLVEEFPYLKIAGISDYGVKVPRINKPKEVSICTSLAENQFRIGR